MEITIKCTICIITLFNYTNDTLNTSTLSKSQCTNQILTLRQKLFVCFIKPLTNYETLNKENIYL